MHKKIFSLFLLVALCSGNAFAYSLNEQEKQKGDLVFSKISKAVESKPVSEQTKIWKKYSDALLKLKLKAKSESSSELINYVVSKIPASRSETPSVSPSCGFRPVYQIQWGDSGQDLWILFDGTGSEISGARGLRVSKDGATVAYVLPKDGKKFVVRDWIQGEGYDDIPDDIHISANGKTVVYVAQKDGQQAVVINGVLGNWYSSIEKVVVSPNGSTVAYIAHQDKKQMVVKNTTEWKPYDGIYGLIVSNNGSAAYAVYSFANKTYSAVKDGVMGKGYSMVEDLTLSIDGKSYAYVGQKNGKDILVKDGKEGSKQYSSIDDPENPDLHAIWGLSYSADGKDFFYAVNAGGKGFLVKNEIAGKKYDSVVDVTVSPVWNSVSYVAEKNGKHIVVRDGAEWKEYDYIHGLMYSPNGEHIAYFGLSGNAVIVKDGAELWTYKGAPEHMIFSDDGMSLSYYARDSQSRDSYLYKDGERYGPYQTLGRGIAYFPGTNDLSYTAVPDYDKKLYINGDEQAGIVDVSSIYFYKPSSCK